MKDRRLAQAGTLRGLPPGALAQLRYTGGGPRFIKLTAKAVRYAAYEAILTAGARSIAVGGSVDA